MNSSDLRDIKEVYSRQPSDLPICGDQVSVAGSSASQSSASESYEIISFRYKGKLGKEVKLTEEEDYFHIRSDETSLDRRCTEVRNYPRLARAERPAARLNKDMIRQLEPEVKEGLEHFLRKVFYLGEGKTISVWDIINEVNNAGYDIFVAGGAIRSLLRRERPKDVDLAGTIPIGAFRGIVHSKINLPGLAIGCNRTGTVLFIEDPFSAERQKPRILEYAPLKLEFCYAHEGQHRWEYDHDLVQDAVYRDLTINSLFCDVSRGLVFDPIGCGWADAHQKPDPNLRVILPLPSEPKGEAVKKLLRLLQFIKRYPNTDRALIIKGFLQGHLQSCKDDFKRLSRLQKVRVVAQAFFGSKKLADQNELRQACVELGIENAWSELFEPLWEWIK